MDLGFLSGLLGGQGNSTLTMLLPLLLGGKTPDLNGLLSALSKGGAEKQSGFPPLFGDGGERSFPKDSGLFNMLGKMFASAPANKDNAQTGEKYPYELQYNRPQ